MSILWEHRQTRGVRGRPSAAGRPAPGLEPWLEKLRPEFPPGGVVVYASDGLPLVKGVDEGEAGEPPARFDPHVWLDPLLAARMVTNIQKGLQDADPQHGELYSANA